MKSFTISEQEKRDILDKYSKNTDDNVFNYLRRHYPVLTHELDFEPKIKMKYLIIDDKTYYLKDNKSYLAEKFKNMLKDEFLYVSMPTLVRTIKKFLSLALLD
jgi:hypothetical protein